MKTAEQERSKSIFMYIGLILRFCIVRVKYYSGIKVVSVWLWLYSLAWSVMLIYICICYIYIYICYIYVIYIYIYMYVDSGAHAVLRNWLHSIYYM